MNDYISKNERELRAIPGVRYGYSWRYPESDYLRVPFPSQASGARLVTVHIKHSISAAHYLPNYDGSCSKMHGHTWKIEVWITGRRRIGGMVVDFRKVKDLLDRYDHTTLNTLVANPTAENLAVTLQDEIRDAAGTNVSRVKVRVWESEDTYAEVE